MTMEDTQTFTAEQLEQAKQEALNSYKSAQEAGVQKLIAEKKQAEQVIDAVGEVAKDPKNLVSIFDQSPEVAQKILDKYYGGKTIDEYKDSIGYEEAPEVMNEKLIEKKAKSIVDSNRIKDAKKAFIEKTGLEGDSLEEFEAEFEERMGLASFSVDDLDKHLTKAYKLATGFSDDKIKEIGRARAVASAGSLAGGDKVKDSERTRIKSEVDDLLYGRL